MIVNNWVKRYQSEGIGRLETRLGRGRKPVQVDDLEQVKEAVKQSHQMIFVAKAELEESLGKEFSVSSLKRFLKKAVDATNEFESDKKANRMKKFTS